jgi:hypothetical protein
MLFDAWTFLAMAMRRSPPSHRRGSCVPMRKAISGREVLEAREHFFMHGNVPHLLLTLLLGDVPAGGEVFRRREG